MKFEKDLARSRGAAENAEGIKGTLFENFAFFVSLRLCEKKFGIIIFLSFVLFVLAACSTKQAPIITSASMQHTLYNGKEQPIEAKAAKDDIPPLEVTYFMSEADLIADRNGTTQAPSEVGYYYVRIRRPAGNGYKAGRDITVEYHIQKALADGNQ
jgi:hypothetical protein